MAQTDGSLRSGHQARQQLARNPLAPNHDAGRRPQAPDVFQRVVRDEQKFGPALRGAANAPPALQPR